MTEIIVSGISSSLDSVSFVIPGEAVPFSYPSTGIKRYIPSKQANFMSVVKLFASRAMGGHPPFEGPLQLTIRAAYKHPQSWSKMKKQQTARKTSKPDLSNIIKLLEDSVKHIVWLDDAQVCHIVAEKVYDNVTDVRVLVSKLLL